MAGDDRPNVLLVHTHDQGRHLGCYGRDVETPRLDALAAEGVRFSNHFCTAPQCSPSRASLLTGRYPHRTGMLGLAHLGWHLDGDVRPLPALLSESGYDTHLFGVQHLARTDPDGPSDLGYDTVHEKTTGSKENRLVRSVAPEVTDFLRGRGRADDPFFASVGFFEPHRLGREYGYGFAPDEYPADGPDDVDPLPYIPDRRPIREDLAAFDGMIGAVDGAVGEILDALADGKLAGDTVVIFTTDHGVPFPRAKGTCYDAGLESALVVRHPEFRPGVRDELLSNVDVLPTLLDYLGVDAPGDLDGRSFLPLLTGDGRYDPRDRVFAEMTYHLKYCPVRAVRTDRYKYVRTLDEVPRVYLPRDVRHGKAGAQMIREYYNAAAPDEELYDLRSDPHEEENLAGDDARREVLERLGGEVDDWMERTGDPLLGGPVEPTDEMRDRFPSPWW